MFPAIMAMIAKYFVSFLARSNRNVQVSFDIKVSFSSEVIIFNVMVLTH